MTGTTASQIAVTDPEPSGIVPHSPTGAPVPAPGPGSMTTEGPLGSSQSLAPATRMAGTLLPDARKLQLMEKVATYIVASGEFERKFRGRGEPHAKAMMMMIKADSLGISINDALEHVYVIDGKTGLSGQLMLRLINERCPNRIFDVEESTDQVCRILMGRPGGKPRHFEFTIERAQKAGLLERKKDGEVRENFAWKAYPQEMLQWRAIAKGARVTFPEILQGCYLVDELTSGPDLSEAGEWAVQQVVEESIPPADPQPPAKVEAKKPDPQRRALRNLIYNAAGLVLEAEGLVPNAGDWDDRFKAKAQELWEKLSQEILGHVPEQGSDPELTSEQIGRMQLWLKTRKRDALLRHVCWLGIISRGESAPPQPGWEKRLEDTVDSTWNEMCKTLVGSPLPRDFAFSEELIDLGIRGFEELQQELKAGLKV